MPPGKPRGQHALGARHGFVQSPLLRDWGEVSNDTGRNHIARQARNFATKNGTRRNFAGRGRGASNSCYKRDNRVVGYLRTISSFSRRGAQRTV